MLPVGSLIQDVEVDESTNRISFNTEDERNIVIQFAQKWHPGRNVVEFADMLVTSKNFKDMTKAEISAIKSGVLIEGMSKGAVLVAYGPPPERGTISLEANKWTYWHGRFDSQNICFDEKDLLQSSCPDDLGNQSKSFIGSLGGKIRHLLGE